MANANNEQSDVTALVTALNAQFGDTDLSLSNEYSYSCVPLCFIDSIFSIQTKYTTTQKVVKRWAEYCNWPLYSTVGAMEATVSEFLQKVKGISFETLAGDFFKNRQRTSSKSGILKSEAAVQFAVCLRTAGIDCFADLQDQEKTSRAGVLVRQIKGQASGITWKYFLMMVGDENSIKPDTWICRYVARVIGRGTVSAIEAEELLLSAVKIMQKSNPKIKARSIDHAIWRAERSRRA